MPDQLENARQRAAQFQHVDGSFELTFGGTFLLVAACTFLVNGAGIRQPSLLRFLPLLVFLFGCFLLDALVKRLRWRLTYPRSGYMAPLPPRPARRPVRVLIWIGIPVLTALVLLLLILNRPVLSVGGLDPVSFLMPAFFSLLFSALLAIAAWKIGVPRFYLLAAVTLVAGEVLFLTGVGGDRGIAWLFLVLGILLCLSGSLTLWGYLRKTSPPAGMPDER
jgi:hypothetical protein